MILYRSLLFIATAMNDISALLNYPLKQFIGTVHQYESHTIAQYFTACECIITRKFTRQKQPMAIVFKTNLVVLES